MRQIFEEIDRTANTGKFNDQYLLNGLMQNVAIQVGTESTERLTLTLGDYRIATLGSRSMIQASSAVAAGQLALGAVTINGQAIPASASDGVSTSDPTGSALAKARAINMVESQTGVHARALATELAGTAAIQPVSINGTTQRLEINGVAITGVSVQAGDANQTLATAINGKADQTGVTAAVDGSGQLTLSAADGRNIQIVTSGGVGGSLGLTAPGGDLAMTQYGRLELSSTRAFSVVDAGGLLGLGSGTIQVNPNPATALERVSITDAAGVAAALESIDTALAQVSDGRARIGAISNRLEAIGETLAKRIEDLSATDSRIRDTDFAYETARLTQAQILQDAAVAMLTQANIAPQRALELLQNR
jgi:flagellin